MKFCKKCGLPLRWFGKAWSHVLLNGRAIRVGHDPEPVEFANIEAPVGHNDADVGE